MVSKTTKRRREDDIVRYNRGIYKVEYHIDDLTMLYQKNTTKLQPRWRGPFRILDYSSIYSTSFTLKQLNGRSIKGTFHGNHLKTFKPRKGHLTKEGLLPLPLPQQQNIRHRRKVQTLRKASQYHYDYTTYGSLPQLTRLAHLSLVLLRLYNLWLTDRSGGQTGHLGGYIGLQVQGYITQIRGILGG